MSQINRRRFLQSTSAVAATTSLGVFSRTSLARGYLPNERPKIALIGCGGQGTGDGRGALRYGDMVAVCDVDTANSARAKKVYSEQLAKKGKEVNIDVYDDCRAIIDRNDIDAIICGTVDHWHVKVSAEALKSGKDVYCEEPLTLTIDEGRIISKVVKDTGRILQVGTQQRSDERFLKAVAVAHSGRLGKIKNVTVGINHNPFSKALPAVDPPTTLNWDRWKGPTEDVPDRFLKAGKDGQKRTISGKPIEDLESNPLPGGWLEYLYRGKLVGRMQNFFDCIASRNRPASDVWSHVAAINTCHLSNIAIRLNRQIEWDAASQTIKGDAKANSMQARDFRKGYEIEI